MTAEVENVIRRIIDSELTKSHDAETLRSLIILVCNNAMKQYRWSKQEASKQGVKRAKEILEGHKEQNGKRIDGGMVSAHPVLRKVDIDGIMGSGNVVEETALKRLLQELKQREDMLRALLTFRPKETVFEAFATGGSKITGVLGRVDKGRTISFERISRLEYAYIQTARSMFVSKRALRLAMDFPHWQHLKRLLRHLKLQVLR